MGVKMDRNATKVV